MAYQLQEINKRIRSDVRSFLAECDENYAQRVSLAADRIMANLERSPIVLLSGLDKVLAQKAEIQTFYRST